MLRFLISFLKSKFSNDRKTEHYHSSPKPFLLFLQDFQLDSGFPRPKISFNAFHRVFRPRVISFENLQQFKISSIMLFQVFLCLTRADLPVRIQYINTFGRWTHPSNLTIPCLIVSVALYFAWTMIFCIHDIANS